MGFLREFKAAWLAIAPQVCALLAVFCGIMLMASGATPVELDRFHWVIRLIPEALSDAAHLLSSLLGLILAMSAFGLYRRLQGARTLAMVTTVLSALMVLFKGVNWEEAGVLILLAMTLLLSRAAFHRASAWTRIEVTPTWMVGISGLVLGTALLTYWSFLHPPEHIRGTWRALFQADVQRSIHAAIALGIVFLAFGIWRLVSTPAMPPIVGEEDQGLSRVRAILAKAQGAAPEANLALLGDKRFLFSKSGQSFLMFGVRGRSWIAVGAPVGLRAERSELLWAFRELADAHAARPGIYGIGPDMLPDVVEMGFSIQKIGECADIALADFSVAGRRRGVLRRDWRKASEAGASFAVVSGEALRPLLPRLKQVSDRWLKTRSGTEKAFTLGHFSEAYVMEFPCAVVRDAAGEVIAFANLWLTPDRTVFSIDLMRYDESHIKNVMDFLFIELLLWGRAEGYGALEFGSAPLAGLPEHRLAPILSHLGRFVYERGEDFYNFQGVRRYKDKYDPIWQPRYLCAPHNFAIPILLADVGLLTSGGMAGLTGKRT